MDLPTCFDESFPLRFALTLLHFLWQGCVVTLVVLLASWMLRGASAKWRYAINLAAMLLMVACLPVTYAFVDVSHVAWGSVPDADGFGEPSYETISPDPTTRVHALVPSMEINDSHALADGSQSDPATQDGAINHGSEMSELNSHEPTSRDEPEPGRALAWIASVAPYLTAIYILGVTAMTCRLAGGLWGGLRLRRVATPVDEESLLAMIRRQAKRIGLKTAPMIAYCEQISIPVLIGIIKPTILLPAALASGLAPDQLQTLVMHELAHIRRFDLLVNLLQRLIEALLFFHPAVWYVSRRVSMEREHCADDAVVAAGWRRITYADALVRMAELSSALRNTHMANEAIAVAASGTGNTEFKRRILRLLDDDNRPKLCLPPVSMAVLVAVAAFAFLAPLLVQAWAQTLGEKAEGPSDLHRAETDTASSVLHPEPPQGTRRRVRLDETSSTGEEVDNDPSSKAKHEHSPHSATIVDPAGQPVADARVEFAAVEQQCVAAFAPCHMVTLARQTAVTNHRGVASVSLSLDRSWPGYLDIRASAPGMIRHHRQVGNPAEDPRVVLWRATPLSGRVLDPDGKPVAGAIVYGRRVLPQTKDVEEPRHRNWMDYVNTDKNGEFILARPSGLKMDLRVHSYAGVPLERSVDAETDALGNIRLTTGTMITGVVLNEAGEPISGILVQLKAASSNYGKPASCRAVVLTDAHGTFRLPPRRGPMILRLGRVDVPLLQPEIATVRAARDLPYIPEVINLPSASGEISRTIRAAPAVTIRGRITDSEGKPVPGRAKSEHGWYNREVTVTWDGNDAGGRCVIMGCCQIDGEGRYELTVARGLGPVRIDAFVAGYSGHHPAAKPVADGHDPTIRFYPSLVVFQRLERDIHNLNWRLVRQEQRDGEEQAEGSSDILTRDTSTPDDRHVLQASEKFVSSGQTPSPDVDKRGRGVSGAAENETPSESEAERSSHFATIVDPTGQPIAGAQVEFVAIETQAGAYNGAYHMVKLAQQTAITDRQGTASVRLPLANDWDGFLDIRAWAPGMIRHHRHVWRPGEDPRVVLWRATPLRGRVLDPDGKPVAGAIVYGRGLLSRTKDADEMRLRRWMDYVKTNANGEFTLPRPTGLKITLKVSSFAGVPLERKVDANTGVVGDLRLSSGTSVTGIVLDEAGEPLSEILVELKAANIEHNPASFYAAVLTDEDGRFRLPPRRGPMILALGQVAAPSLRPEIATVRTARDLPYVPEVIELSARRGEVSRTIRAAPAVTIRGQITDSVDKPVPGRAKSEHGWYARTVSVYWEGNDAGDRLLTLGRCRIDREGRYELTLARGLDSARLHAKVAGYRGHNIQPEPIADRDDPTIQFQKYGVKLRNIERDIHNLNWRLVRQEHRDGEKQAVESNELFTRDNSTTELSSHSATIVDPAGQPVAGARVEFVAVESQTVLPSYGYHQVDRAKQAAITDRRGTATVSLPLARGWDGFLDIRASAPGMIRHHRHYWEPIENPRVVLWWGTPLVGRVVDWRGEPVAGAIVYGHAVLPQTKDAEDPRHRKWTDYARTKGTGHFTLTRPAGVEVNLRVCSYAGVPLHVSVDSDTEVLGDLRLSPGTMVTGIVLDADGKPAAGVLVELTGADSKAEAAASDAAVLTDEYGHFCLPPRRGQLTLSLGDVAKPSQRPENATIRTAQSLPHVPELLDLPGRDREIARTIRAAPAVTIRGQITDSDGKPVPGRVEAKKGHWWFREVYASWGGNDAGNRSVWLDRCRIDDEGRYELMVASDVDAIRLWSWVAGHPGHDMGAVPVADKDDPMIELHERGVNLRSLDRDIQLNWRLVPHERPDKEEDRGLQTTEVSPGSRYLPESPHLKARLDDLAELLDLPEGTDPPSMGISL